MKLNNKEAKIELFKKWKKEMDDNRKVDWRFMGLTGLFKLWWWGYFKQYRLIFFMQRCCDGMSHVLAWKYAKEQSKQEILETLAACGWE